MNLVNIIKHHLDDEESIEFAKWCVGDSYDTIPCKEFLNTWNVLHGDIFKLNDCHDPRDDIPIMIAIYSKYKDSKYESK